MAYTWRPTDDEPELEAPSATLGDEFLDRLCRFTASSQYVKWWTRFYFQSRRDQSAFDPMASLFLPRRVAKQLEGVRERSELIFPGGLGPENLKPWKVDAKKLPKLAKDTLIVGVIDTGIPLSHARLRDRDGKSRVISSWQMNLHEIPDPNDPHAPLFGSELFSDDIDDLFAKHQQVGGNLDEMGFNRDAGLVDMWNRQGPRDLARRFAHGAAVVDLAAGIDADGPPVDIWVRGDKDNTVEIDAAHFADKVKVITVNLPYRGAVGLSGEFLDFFVLLGVRRITQIARALWTTHHEGEPGGFDLMINLSYGRQAGSKGFKRDEYGELLADLINDYRSETKTERPADRVPADGVCDFFVPVGNDNLARVHCDIENLEKGGATHSQNFRIQPGDQSCSYIEFWAKRTGDGAACLEVAIAEPGNGQPVDDADFMRAKEGGVWSLGPQGREFAQLRIIRADVEMIGGLICIAPTEQPDTPLWVAPAGAWRLHIRNAGDVDVDLRLMVQSEQSLRDQTSTSRRAYFEEKNYLRFHPVHGGAIDSFSVERTFGKVTPNEYRRNYGDDAAEDTKLRRHGTLIATSEHENACIAGYRRSDGAPAPYSSTGLGRRVDEGRGAPTASLPSDDGAAHPGVLTAGAANGSAAIAQGTSFSSALATRFVVEQRLAGAGDYFNAKNEKSEKTGQKVSGRDRLYWDSTRNEASLALQVKHTPFIEGTKAPNTTAKIGGGRLRVSNPRKVDRM